MELEITTERADGVCMMSLSGEVDVYTAPRLKQSLVEQIESGCARIIVDLEGVGFIDSSGLGVLVGGLRRAKERDGTIRLVCTRDNILKIFRITGLDKVFAIFPEAAEAREF
jgi:anti-sigma B factor antagonist